jgi:hypothetical protein
MLGVERVGLPGDLFMSFSLSENVLAVKEVRVGIMFRKDDELCM